MIVLRQKDMREALPGLQTASVDLIVSDVAYDVISGGNTTKHRRCGGILNANDGKIFKENNIHISEYAAEMFRVLKDPSHCYIMSNVKNMFEVHAEMIRAGFKLHNVLMWRKNTVNPNRWYMKNGEYILMFRKGKAFPIANKSTKTIMDFDDEPIAIEVKNIVGPDKPHPTVKPVLLMETLIRNSSKPGDWVLDMFMGSGTTGEAAINLGRNFIGIEMDPEHYLTACKRLGVMPS